MEKAARMEEMYFDQEFEAYDESEVEDGDYYEERKMEKDNEQRRTDSRPHLGDRKLSLAAHLQPCKEQLT